MPLTYDMNTSTIGLPEVGLAATTQDKATNLSNKVQEKTATLSRGQSIAQNIESINKDEYKPAMLQSLSDGDTPVLVGGNPQGLRLGGDPTTGQEGWVDARETYHGKFSETSNEIARANRQARQYGLKDPIEVYKQGEIDRLEQLYNAMGRPIGVDGKEWTPGPIEYDPRTTHVELGSVDNPLNIPVNVRQSADKSHGRDVAYITDADKKYNLNAELAKKGLLYQPDSKVQTTQQQTSNETPNLDKLLNGPSNNTLRGVGAATLNVGAKVGSLIGEGVESVGELFGSKGVTGAGTQIQKVYTDMQRTGFADKLTGYDNTDAQNLQKEIDATIKQDGYLAAIGKAVTDSRSLEVLATSVPEMVALAVSVGGMAVANANNNINIGEAELGRPFTPEEKALSAVTSIASTYLDRWGDKLAVSGMNPTKLALKEAVDKAPDAVKNVLASKFGAGILKIGEVPLKLTGAATVEGGTEYLQTLGENAAQRPDVFKSGFTDKELDEAGVAGVLGAAMGTHMAVPSVAKDAVFGNGNELSEEQKKVLSSPEVSRTEAKVVDEFWSKMKQAKADTNDEVSMRNREEVRNIATDFVKGKDTLGILASDLDTKEKLDKVKELLTFVAEDSGLDEETKKLLTGKLSDQLGVEPTKVAGLVEEAHKTGEAIRALKSVDDVDNEVTTGPRGFLTYYNDAVEAMRNGDQKAVEDNTRKLEKFIGVQELKQARFEAAQKEVLREYADRVEMLKKTTGMSELDARKEVYNQWAKERNKGTGTVDVPYSDERVKPFKLFKSQVIENEVAKGRGQVYDFGGYKAIVGINKSIEAMNVLHKQLTGDAAISEGLPKVTKEWIDKKLAEGTKPDELVTKVEKDTGLTTKQKEAVVEYVKEKEPEVAFEEPKVEVDEKETPDVPYEEPADVNMDEDPNIDFEEPSMDYVEAGEINDVFGEPEEPMYEEAALPGERPVRTTKEALEQTKDVKIVVEKAGELAKTQRELAKAKAEGDTEKVGKLTAKIDTIKKWSEMKAVHSPVNKLLAAARRLYFGDALATRLANTLKVKEVTPLNVGEVIADKKAIEAVEAAIPPAEMTKSGAVNQNDAYSDPARALLFNNDGSMNGNVVTALWKTMNDYLATSAGGLTKPMTTEKLEEMFPFIGKLDGSNPEDMDLMFDLMRQMEDGGELLKLEAEGIGSDVMKLLGLSAADGSVPERDVQGFKTSLGMMVVNMAVARGDLKVTKIEAKGSGTIPVLQANRDLFDRLDDVLDERDKYITYDNPDAPRKSYSFEPIVRNDVEVHNQPYTNVTPLQKEMKQTLDQLEFRPNDGMAVLLELYGDDKEGLKDALGRKSKAELDKMSYDGKKAAESVNREIEVKVDAFYQMEKDAKKGDGYRPMWFEWFVTKGGRTNSFATVVDPQSDKQLARWLVTTEGSRVDVKVSDLKENTQIGLGFKYGIVQAFDGVLPEKVEVDKNSKEKVVAMADRLMSMNDEELKAMVKDSEHIGHAMLALANIRKAKQGDFTSDMVMEMDGLTNGLGFRLVQFPMDDTMKLLPKVGVVRESDPMWEAETIAEVKDGKYGEFLDLYETVGANLADAKIELSGANKETQKALKDVLPDLTDRKTSRKIAKSPVMVTGYSAGETSTKLSIVNEQISNLVEQIVEGKISKEALDVVLKGTGVSSDKIVELLKTKSIRDPKLANVRAKLTNFYLEAYAEPMYGALLDTIGSMRDVGTSITSAYGYMYEVLMNAYKDKLQAKVATLDKKRTLSSDEKIEIMREILEEVGPIVRNSETVGKLDRVLALSRELVNIADEADKAGIGGTYATSVNSKSKAGVDTVQLVMRGFGEPGAAGGVLQTHTEDNHAMARTMMDSKKKFNQVFDAMVLGVGQWDDVNGYNKSFYELNKEFSMMDAVIEAVERNAKSKYSEGVTVKVGKEQIDGNDLLKALNEYKQEIDKNRAAIFGENVKIGQMVGVSGTMYKVDAKQESARIEEMKNEVKTALQKFANAAEGLLKGKLVEIVNKMECN